jgi:NAD(P)-dependent dehydrogenase (short-subunit alcohol dehydrogenase family)
MVKKMHSMDDRSKWLRYVPMKRYAQPHEIATAVEYLLDNERASYITGEILAVDGGFRGAGVLAED